MSALDDAIDAHLKGTCISPWTSHDFVHRAYNWDNIAGRTQRVYDNVKEQPLQSTGHLFRKYEPFLNLHFGMIKMNLTLFC